MNIQYIKTQWNEVLSHKDMDSLITRMRRYPNPSIIKHANDVLEQTFTFDKEWDMERCTIPYTLTKMNWNTICNDDEEWTFMLNRMDYLADLIIAYVQSEDVRYLTKCKFYIIDWIKQHEIMVYSLSSRTLDTGMRLSTMMDALMYLYYFKQLTDHEIDTICTHMLDQITYLHTSYLGKYTLSNWGSIQTCNILSTLPLLVEDYVSHELYQWAWKELEVQFRIQVYDDGMHWEQSTMYHVEVLNYGLKVLYIGEVFAMDLPNGLYEALQKMAYALLYQMTPSGMIEAFGDSDRCSLRDVVSKCAYIFKDEMLKARGSMCFDMENLYALGAKAAQAYENLSSIPTHQLHYDGHDSGMYILRTSWDHDASFTMFTNGSLGSGHGHCDNLHVSIHYKGKPFLIDTGRFTYREDHPMRSYLKSVVAHNSVVIDQCCASIPSASWEYEKFSTHIKTYSVHKDDCHYMEGALIGDLGAQMYTQVRKMVIISPSIWLICDELSAKGHHEVKSYYQLDPCVMVQKTANNTCVLTNESIHMKAIFAKGEVRVKENSCSLRYNELSQHQTLVVNTSFQDHGILSSFIIGDEVEYLGKVVVYQASNIAQDSLVSAYKFKVNASSYTIILFHKEVYEGKKIFYCENVAFHAKSLVLHHNKEKLVACIRLKV